MTERSFWADQSQRNVRASRSRLPCAHTERQKPPTDSPVGGFGWTGSAQFSALVGTTGSTTLEGREASL